MQSIKVRDFSLEHTMDCLQFFRLTKENEFYRISHGENSFRVAQKGNKLFFEGVPAAYIRQFFSLDEDYKKIIESIRIDSHINRAIDEYYGLRLIKQEPWECLVSYILSANNSVKKVQNSLLKLSEYVLGAQAGPTLHYKFPSIGALGDKRQWELCSAGYRAGYLADTNKMVDENFLNSIYKMDYDAASKALRQLPGVGPKVCDCVLLFAYSKKKTFPTDTWVGKFMRRHYPDCKDMSDPKIAEFGRNYFGKNAGHAQQFGFYYAFNHPEIYNKYKRK